MTDTNWFKDVFLRLIENARPERMSIGRWLDILFRFDKRTITTYQAVQACNLKGAIWVDSVPVEGLINKRITKIKAGQYVTVREDRDEPYVSVETYTGTINIKKGLWENEYKRFFEPGHRDNKSRPKR